MTLHIGKEDHSCLDCSEIFIPYGSNPTCPNCNKENFVSEEYVNFISRCAGSLIFNRNKYGSYTPRAWYKKTFSDFVQYRLFMALDLIEENQPVDVSEYVDYLWEKVIWTPAQKRHIKEIFLAVYKEIKKKPTRSILQTLLFKDKYGQCIDNLPDLPEYIQLPEHLNHWFGQEVFISHGLERSIYIRNKDQQKLIEKRIEEIAKKLDPENPELGLRFFLDGILSYHIKADGVLALPKFLYRFLPNEGQLEFVTEDNRLVLRKTAKDIKSSNVIIICGEEFQQQYIPHVAEMIENNREGAEAQIISISNAWHEGSIVGAVQALESDLSMQG